MRPTKEMFRHWSHYRKETIARSEFLRLMQPIRKEVDSLLLRGVFSGNSKLKGMCKPLYDHGDWLWTFLDVDGVQPTNNASERALCPAVMAEALLRGLKRQRKPVRGNDPDCRREVP